MPHEGVFFTAAKECVVRGVVFARAENERVILEVFRILRRTASLQVIGGGERKVVAEPRGSGEKPFGRRFVGKVGNIDALCQDVFMIAFAHEFEFNRGVDLLVVLQLPNERIASDIYGVAKSVAAGGARHGSRHLR